MLADEKKLRDDLFDIFANVPKRGIYAINYEDEFHLDFRIGSADFPRFCFSKFGQSRILAPYYPPMVHTSVSTSEAYDILDLFADTNALVNISNRTKQGGELERTFRDPRRGIRYAISAYHPNGWMITADSNGYDSRQKHSL